MKIFEKYGLDVAPNHIASGSASYSALLAGDVHVVSDTASAAVAAGSRAPIMIFAGSWAIPYKLIAHPSITSLDGLKGKIVGISFVGAGSDFLLRRLLPKLGLIPGKDVTLIPTGIGRSDLRIQLIFQGKIDATLGTADNVSQLALRGLKVGVLGDLAEWGVVTTGGDFAGAARSILPAIQRHQPIIHTTSRCSGRAVAAMRKAFDVTFTDPEFQADIEPPAVLRWISIERIRISLERRQPQRCQLH